MRLRGWAAVAVWASVAALTCTAREGSADAQPPGPVVWYRGAEGCPAAAEFVTRLRERGVEGRIAGVGDRVDFVVTLGASPAGHAGRLERQTDAGTVAVRELSAPTCTEVADGIALGLALAFDARATASIGADTQTTASIGAGPSGRAPGPARADARSSAAGTPPIPPRAATPDQPATLPVAPPPARRRWAAGGQFGIAAGVSPDTLLGVGLFVERSWPRPTVVSPSLRLDVHGLFSSSETAVGEVKVRIGALRLEGCPLELPLGPLALRPCAGAEAGVLSASGSGPRGLVETRFWGAAAAHARLLWALVPPVSIEAQGGVLLPFSRYTLETADPPEVLHRADLVAFTASFGLAYRWQ